MIKTIFFIFFIILHIFNSILIITSFYKNKKGEKIDLKECFAIVVGITMLALCIRITIITGYSALVVAADEYRPSINNIEDFMIYYAPIIEKVMMVFNCVLFVLLYLLIKKEKKNDE